MGGANFEPHPWRNKEIRQVEWAGSDNKSDPRLEDPRRLGVGPMVRVPLGVGGIVGPGSTERTTGLGPDGAEGPTGLVQGQELVSAVGTERQEDTVGARAETGQERKKDGMSPSPFSPLAKDTTSDWIHFKFVQFSYSFYSLMTVSIHFIVVFGIIN